MSNRPLARRPKADLAPVPDSASPALLRGLAVAGYSEEEQQAIARKAVEGVLRLTQAMKVQRLIVSAGKGSPSEVLEYEDEDNTTRLNANVELAKMAGAYVSRTDPRGAGPAVVINLPPPPDWAAPQQHGEVIEAERPASS